MEGGKEDGRKVGREVEREVGRSEEERERGNVASVTVANTTRHHSPSILL